MEAWPFSKAEWTVVSEAARHILNATLAEDDVFSGELTSDNSNVFWWSNTKQGLVSCPVAGCEART